MNSEMIIQIIKDVQKAYEANASEIEKLDQAIGDGDHVINMRRGMKAMSTLSQLGYMTVALGASAYAAGVFHLMTELNRQPPF